MFIQNANGDIMAKSKLIKKAPHADLTYEIIGAAMAVHRKLGPGYARNNARLRLSGEKIYQKNLEKEFQRRGIAFEAPKRIEVHDERLSTD